MSIPPLRPDGTLPPGGYDATLDEVIAAYPATTPQRQALNDALIRFVEVARRLGTVHRIAVDGSYITSKPDPGDVDIAALTPGMYQQEGEQQVGAEGVDLVLLDAQFAHDASDFQRWVDFFATERDMTPKGIIYVIV
jgi:hypothetical protein